MEGTNYIISVAHVGIAVPDIAEARKQYEMLGYTALGEAVAAVDHGVNTLMMSNNGFKIELLSPLQASAPSPIDSYIATKPYKMYHIAYYVSNFDAQIELLKKQRYIMVDEPRASEAQGGKRTVFMFNRKLGIIELVEA